MKSHKDVFFLFQIKANVTAWRRRVMAKQLRESFNNNTSQEYRVYIGLPVKHQGHLQGEVVTLLILEITHL